MDHFLRNERLYLRKLAVSDMQAQRGKEKRYK